MSSSRHLRSFLAHLSSQWKYYPVSVRLLPLIFMVFLLLTLFVKGPHRTKRDVGGDGNRFKKSVSVADFTNKIDKENYGIDREVESLLTKAFRAADFDGNGKLTDSELEVSIQAKVNNHIKTAMRTNFQRFFKLDKKIKNGQVDWDEYYEYFLMDRFSLKSEQVMKINLTAASREIKEGVALLKAAWSEAARSNPKSLNIDEFLSLEHPESSMFVLIAEVENILIKKDKDGDGKLSKDEYSSHKYQDIDPDEKSALATEFITIDLDNSGVAERKELIKFLDAKNRYWSKKDARNIRVKTDADADNTISLKEMLAQANVFLDSKFINPGVIYHPDF